MERPGKRSYYLAIAKAVSQRSTCLRKRWGAVIVKDDSIVSTGYNGAPRGCTNCSDLNTCWRAEHNIPRGTRYEACLSKNSVIKLLNGEYMTIEDMANSDKDQYWIYAVDTETGAVVPAIAKNPHPTKKVESLVRITFDDGGYIECTPDHLIMRRDCSYTEAAKLKPGDSVMPLYYRFENANHEYIHNTVNMRKESRWAISKSNATTKTITTHKLVYSYCNNDTDLKGYDIHHKDLNPHNNEPSNLEKMLSNDHRRYHNNLQMMDPNSAFNAYNKERHLKYLATKPVPLTPEEAARRKSESSRRNMRALWDNPTWVASRKPIQSKSAKKLAAKYNSDPAIILKRRRAIVAKGINQLYWNMHRKGDWFTWVTAENYDTLRKKYQSHNGKGKGIIPSMTTILKYYNTFEEALDAGEHYNHKVVSVVEVPYNGWVYDMEVPEFHNFAVDIGTNSCVFVHNCRANGVHAEGNAIIAAARDRMIGSTMYIYGWDREAGTMVHNPDSCQMCKRMIINAGIDEVVFAEDEFVNPKTGANNYKTRRIKVEIWVRDGAVEPNLEGY